MTDIIDFDYIFYSRNNPDLNLNTEEEYRKHYYKYGFLEGRSGSIKVFKRRRENTNKLLNQSINSFKKLRFKNKKNNSVLFNILIRTHKRPKMFNKCIKSILKQTYKNFRILVSYDDEETNKYLKNYSMIEKFSMNNIKSDKKYKFNLYFNELLNKVNKGWIIFLDDDDEWVHENFLHYLSLFLNNKNNLIIWKFMRPDKIIYHNQKIKKGQIDTTSFCFHCNHKNKSKWDDEVTGDYTFIKKLTKSFNFNINRLPFIFTKTQYDNKVAGFGIANEHKIDTICDSIYLINLNKDKIRLKNFKNRTRNLINNYIRIKGVDPLSDEYKDDFLKWERENLFEITIDNFDYDSYLKNNPDLNIFKNRIKAFKHYKKYGIKELRSSYKNNKIINKGQWGCLQSHINILKKAINENKESILIFEDDAIFKYNHSDINDSINNINNLKKKQWKIIYLGASQYNWNNIKIKNNFYKARNTTGSFGILLHNSVFKILLKKYEEYNNPVDHCLIMIQELYSDEVYVSYPNLCIANLESSNIGSVRNNELWASRFRWNLNKYLF